MQLSKNLIITILFATLPLRAESDELLSLYQEIGNEYITPSELEEAKPKTKTQEELDAEIKNMDFFKRMMVKMGVKFPDFERKPLTKGQRKVLLFNTLLPNNSQPLPDNKVLEKNSWQDLELFKFGTLIDSVKRTRTAAGDAVFARMLVTPLADIPSLRKRQAAIEELVEDEELYEELTEALKNIQKGEGFFLRIWENPDEIQQQYLDAINAFNTLGLKFIPHARKSATVQEIGARTTQALQILTIAANAASAAIPLLPQGTLPGVWGRLNIHNPEIPLNFKLFLGGWSILYAFGTKATIDSISLIFEASRTIQEKLIHVSSVLRGVRSIHEQIARNPILRQNIENFQAFDKLFNKTQALSSDINKLIQLLETDTFKGEPSAFSRTGRILAANNIINEVRDEFIPVLETLGTIDAYVSVARLYKEHEKSSARYCFAEFVESDTPYLELTDFWNPMLPAEKAIPNSMTLGAKEKARNVILTGQNTAGKSTIIKGMMDTILMAQVFGVGPASKIKFTPFSVLNTNVNITDDLKNGRSLFANEVHWAKVMLDRIKSLGEHEFSFTIIDEMFRGTGPEHAELLSYRYAKTLAKRKNALVIESTHYPKLKDLESETNGLYKNYKVEIYQQENGSLFRPYKLEEGYTLTNIAAQILQEQGLLFDED